MYTVNGLIQKSLENKDLKYLNILPPYLFNEIEQNYTSFIYDYIKKYSNIPSTDVFYDKFKSFRKEENKDIHLAYYFDQLKPLVLEEYVQKRHKERKDKGLSIYDAGYISELANLLKLRNPEHIEYSKLDRNEYFDSTTAISYGIPFLDNWFGSLGSTDLIGIFGRLKSNKTTFMQVLAFVLFAKQKRNILVFSNENTPIQFAQTFDSFLGRFNNKKFRSLVDSDKEELKNKMEVVKQKLKNVTNEIILAGSAKTPNDIIAAIRNCKGKPDAIYLDGLHAMSFNAKDTGSQSLSVAETMKALRDITYEYRVPIIFVTQANRTASKTDEPGAESVALSDSIPQYVDGMMGCSIVEYNGIKYCKIYLTANRFGDGGLTKFMHIDYEKRIVTFHDIKDDGEVLKVVGVNDDDYVDSLKDESNEE